MSSDTNDKILEMIREALEKKFPNKTLWNYNSGDRLADYESGGIQKVYEVFADKMLEQEQQNERATAYHNWFYDMKIPCPGCNKDLHDNLRAKYYVQRVEWVNMDISTDGNTEWNECFDSEDNDTELDYYYCRSCDKELCWSDIEDILSSARMDYVNNGKMPNWEGYCEDEEYWNSFIENIPNDINLKKLLIKQGKELPKEYKFDADELKKAELNTKLKSIKERW